MENELEYGFSDLISNIRKIGDLKEIKSRLETINKMSEELVKDPCFINERKDKAISKLEFIQYSSKRTITLLKDL